MKAISLKTIVSAAALFSTFANADEAKPKFSLYGFLLPTWTLSSAGVESFSQQNGGAYTAASNPVLQRSPNQARSTFQVAQSRFGFVLEPASSVRGRMEFDFIDFSKSSPTTAALPRVRRAVVEADIDDSTVFRFGQDWDLFSPTNPITFNPVGNYFQAGNIGFMRIQAQLLHRSGDFEHAVAIGLPGNNNASVDSTLELTVAPTLSIREIYHPSKGTQMGVSALASTLRRDANTSSRIFAGAANLFYDAKVDENLELRGEIYVGQNTANIGSLGLAFGGAGAESIKEAGGYLTGRLHVTTQSAVFAGVGAAWVLNPKDMLFGYTGAALSNTGPGIERNLTGRVGYQWNPTQALTVFSELAALSTRHHLRPADSALGSDRSAIVSQSGVMFSF